MTKNGSPFSMQSIQIERIGNGYIVTLPEASNEFMDMFMPMMEKAAELGEDEVLKKIREENEIKINAPAPLMNTAENVFMFDHWGEALEFLKERFLQEIKDEEAYRKNLDGETESV